MDEKQIAALREDFEAWARDEYGGAIALARLGEDYKYSGPSDSWAGFLACARTLEPKWLPIETASKFGEPIDIWSRHGRIPDCVWGKPTYADGLGWIHEAGYDSNGPVFEFVVDPTHWMPLPEQPKAAMSAALEEKNATNK